MGIIQNCAIQENEKSFPIDSRKIILIGDSK
jgi:hypothetical protein